MSQCCCFLPSCALCRGRAASITPCHCFLPSCITCFPPQDVFRPGYTRLVDSGRVATAEMSEVIATVDTQLGKMLKGDGDVPKYLGFGPEYSTLPTWDAKQGSRHDHLVALLCGCGVYAVQSARKLAERAQAERTATIVAPLPRGPRAQVSIIDDAAIGDSSGNPEDVDMEDGGLLENAGVHGTYAKAAASNPIAHATGLVLGRLYLYAAVSNIPDTTVGGLLAQYSLAHVNIGQKFHDRSAISSFCGLAARLVQTALRFRFWQALPNLRHPSAWRLTFDGVTLPGGLTVVVIVVIWTTVEGIIEAGLVGCVPCGTRHDGEHEACVILAELEKVLNIQSRKASCASLPGLPTPTRARGAADCSRAAFLTCMDCDRAYCGRTGTLHFFT